MRLLYRIDVGIWYGIDTSNTSFDVAADIDSSKHFKEAMTLASYVGVWNLWSETVEYSCSEIDYIDIHMYWNIYICI